MVKISVCRECLTHYGFDIEKDAWRDESATYVYQPDENAVKIAEAIRNMIQECQTQ